MIRQIYDDTLQSEELEDSSISTFMYHISSASFPKDVNSYKIHSNVYLWSFGIESYASLY
jgi:hypothetical protein